MLKFDISNSYTGTGVSQGLDRGLLVYKGDDLLLEEGMGLGACAYQTGGFTYFTSIKHIKKTKASFEVIYSMDRRLELTVLGIKTKLITRAQEFLCTYIYMKYKRSQKPILKLWELSRILFRVQSCFTQVPPLGEAKIIYKISGSGILADISYETEKAGGRFFVMNELGGSLFDKSIVGGQISEPPLGWQKMERGCELFSRIHSLAFTIEEKYVPHHVKSSLFWGREHVLNNCCWAGFESEIICNSKGFKNYTYLVRFREVPNEP